MNDLVRIDLGCGHTKAEGYLGIDRYNLPGVDIVADVNRGIPLEDNSVDIVLCSHSLEHFDNIFFIMEEIYRVCKHRSLIYVLSPYHMETVNFANFYHKQVFNESTFRFFTSDSTTPIDKRDYYNPHAGNWGLGLSDNSRMAINIHTISMEYFYFPDYIDLSEEEKRNARRSLQNVCDQIYYILAVNKSEAPFTLDETVKLKKIADKNEPAIINQVRSREINQDMGTSILSDIKKWDNRLEGKFDEKLDTKIKETQNLLTQSEKQLCQLEKQLRQLENVVNHNDNQNYSRLNELKSSYDIKINNLVSELEKTKEVEKQLLREIVGIKQKNEEITNILHKVSLERNSLTSYVLELMKSKESRTFHFGSQELFRKSHDLYQSVADIHRRFMDGLILHNRDFKKSSILRVSNTVPYNEYFEYSLFGVGNKIHYFLVTNLGANLFVELVQNGVIIQQESFTVTHEGMHVWELEREINGEVQLRFRVGDNYSIVRLLEINNRRFMVFSKKTLAAYISSN